MEGDLNADSLIFILMPAIVMSDYSKAAPMLRPRSLLAMINASNDRLGGYPKFLNRKTSVIPVVSLCA